MANILERLANRPTGLLQAISDPFARQEEPEVDPSQFKLDTDPSLNVLLNNPRINPIVKGLLRDQERQRIREERIRFALAQERVEQLREQKKFFVLAFGFIPTFQFGTAFGLKGLPALAVDLVADPLNLLALPGLTKLGRATKFLEGLTVSEKIEALTDAAKFIAKVKALPETEALDIVTDISQAAARRDFFTVRDVVKKLGKSLTGDELERVAQEVGDTGIVNLLRGDREAFRGLRALLEVGEEAENQTLQKTFLQRVAAGQSAFLRVDIPFFDVEVFPIRFEGLLQKLGVRTVGKTSDVGGSAIRSASRTLRVQTAATARVAGATEKIGRKLTASIFSQLPVQTIDEVARTGNVEEAIRLGKETVEEDLFGVRSVIQGLGKTEKDLLDSLEKITGRPRQEIEGLVDAAVEKIGRDVRNLPEDKVVDAALEAVDDISTKGFIAELRRKKLRESTLNLLAEGPENVPQIRQLVKARIAMGVAERLREGLLRARKANSLFSSLISSMRESIPKVEEVLKTLDLGRDLEREALRTSLLAKLKFRRGLRDIAENFSRILSPFGFSPKVLRSAIEPLIEPVIEAARAGKRLPIAEQNKVVESIRVAIRDKVISSVRKTSQTSKRVIRELEAKSSAFNKGVTRELKRVFDLAQETAKRSRLELDPKVLAREIASDPSTKLFQLQKRNAELAEKLVRSQRKSRIKVVDLVDAYKRAMLPVERQLEGLFTLLDLPAEATVAERQALRVRAVTEPRLRSMKAAAKEFEELLGLERGSIRKALQKSKTVDEAVANVRETLRREAQTIQKLTAPPSGGVEEIARAATDPLGNVSGVVRPTMENPAAVAGLAKDVDSVIESFAGDIPQSFLRQADLSGDFRSFGTQIVGKLNAIQFMKRQLVARLKATFTKDSLVRITRAIDDPKTFPLSDLSEAEQFAASELSRLFQNLGEKLVNEGLIAREQLLQDYVTHLVDVVDRDQWLKFIRDVVEGKSNVISNRGGPFTIQRAFKTLKQLKTFIAHNPGIIELKSESIADVVEAYIGGVGKAVVQNQSLRSAAKLVTPNGAPMVVILGKVKRGVIRMFEAGGVDVEPLATFARRLTKEEGGLGGVRETVRVQNARKEYETIKDNALFSGFGIHRDLAPVFRAAFEPDLVVKARLGDPIGGMDKLVLAMEHVNSLGKTALFRLSPFHFMSLTLSAFALLPPAEAFKIVTRTGKVSLKALFSGDPNKAIMMGLENLASSFRGDGRDLLLRFLKANGKLSAPFVLAAGDDSLDVFTDVLKFAANRSPGPIRSAFDGLRHLNDLVDATMWDVYQNGLKFQAWAHLRQAQILKNPLLLKDPVKLFEVERELANTVGKAFGGVSWENFLLHKNMRKASQFFFIAPDWTLSNLLMARDVFVNLPFVQQSGVGKVLTRDVLRRDIAFKAAMGYAFRSTLYSFLGGNLLNFAFTGKFLWDMDSEAFDKRTGIPRVELPYRDSEGRRQFMDVARMFAEPWKLISDPGGFLRSKVGVLPRSLITVIGVNSFGEPLYGTKAGWMERQMKTGIELTKQFVPITFQEAGRQIASLLGPDILARPKDIRSSIISTVGFPVRSESKVSFERNRRIRFLERGIFPREAAEAERERDAVAVR